MRFATVAAKHCLLPASLATHGNITRNVSATMFPSFASITQATRMLGIHLRQAADHHVFVTNSFNLVTYQQQQQQQQPLFALYIYTLILLNREKNNIFCT